MSNTSLFGMALSYKEDLILLKYFESFPPPPSILVFSSLSSVPGPHLQYLWLGQRKSKDSRQIKVEGISNG